MTRTETREHFSRSDSQAGKAGKDTSNTSTPSTYSASSHPHVASPKAPVASAWVVLSSENISEPGIVSSGAAASHLLVFLTDKIMRKLSNSAPHSTYLQSEPQGFVDVVSHLGVLVTLDDLGNPGIRGAAH